MFTPRSGSSWFGDLLRSTGRLGTPDEFLNQDTNSEVVRRFAARTEANYLNAVETATATPNGVFSMELIWGHVELAEPDLLGYYHDAHFVYMRRKDILAQAISLLLATETGVFHNPGGAPAAANSLPSKILVSPDKTFAGIRKWWGHLLNYECLTEVQFAIRGINPLRLYYEEITEDPVDAVNRVLDHCGVDRNPAATPISSYRPVRGEVNAELSRMFRANQGHFIRKVEALRPPLT